MYCMRTKYQKIGMVMIISEEEEAREMVLGPMSGSWWEKDQFKDETEFLNSLYSFKQSRKEEKLITLQIC